MGLVKNARPQISRIDAQERLPLRLSWNGAEIEAFEGDTILTAILTNRSALRAFEFSAERRAGFCLMGACQDCWVLVNGDRPAQACTTFVHAGMVVKSGCASE